MNISVGVAVSVVVLIAAALILISAIVCMRRRKKKLVITTSINVAYHSSSSQLSNTCNNTSAEQCGYDISTHGPYPDHTRSIVTSHNVAYGVCLSDAESNSYTVTTTEPEYDYI